MCWAEISYQPKGTQKSHSFCVMWKTTTTAFIVVFTISASWSYHISSLGLLSNATWLPNNIRMCFIWLIASNERLLWICLYLDSILFEDKTLTRRIWLMNEMSWPKKTFRWLLLRLSSISINWFVVDLFWTVLCCFSLCGDTRQNWISDIMRRYFLCVCVGMEVIYHVSYGFRWYRQVLLLFICMPFLIHIVFIERWESNQNDIERDSSTFRVL